jgi:hypothetical protein
MIGVARDEDGPVVPADIDLDRRARMAVILERDGAECVWCRRPLEVGLVGATTEHVVPRIKGGPSWIENEVAACRRCNGERGHRTPGEWLDECERRGWEPNRDVVEGTLAALLTAIERRGGQRRARPYIAAQLRRLRRGRPQSTVGESAAGGAIDR